MVSSPLQQLTETNPPTTYHYRLIANHNNGLLTIDY